MTILFWFTAAALTITTIGSPDLLMGNRSVYALRDMAPDFGRNLPRIPVIVAA